LEFDKTVFCPQRLSTTAVRHEHAVDDYLSL
jgi:hypothetical protein